jgi:hypothetical protein
MSRVLTNALVVFLAGVMCAAAWPQAKADKGNRSDLVVKTEEYRARLVDLLPFYERTVEAATEKQERMRGLFKDGLVSKHDLEAAERVREDAEGKIAETRVLIAQSEHMIAEAKLADEIERASASPSGGAVIRYEGRAAWSLAKVDKVESFFSKAFGYPLPVSALGQTTLHERMGFAHQNAVDVAVHPDSAEGQQLMQYLRKSGYPFIAFRAALPGSATGAHIHVGKPSLRIASSD